MTTLDQTALLAAILANPDEDTPRLMYADYLDGLDTVRVPCFVCWGAGIHRSGYVKCDVRGIHDSRREEECLHCKGTGTVPDTANADRAEFIRVQCELATYHRPGGMFEIPGRDSEKLHVKELFARETALRDKNERTWLAVGACEQCGGFGVSVKDRGKGGWTTQGTVYYCQSCHGTGDTGGFLRPGCEVQWARGWPWRVTVPEMGWLVEGALDEDCPTCRGIKGEQHHPTCSAAPATRAVSSRWLRAVLTADVSRGLIAEVVPKCRVPATFGINFGWMRDRNKDGVIQDPVENATILADVWDELTGCEPKKFYDTLWKSWKTPELAVAALGRAFVAWSRSKASQ